jgi:plasmid stabilization system protein ParE
MKSIAKYTRKTWGSEQCIRYLSDVDRFLELLAQTPLMGRPYASILPGLYRIEKQNTSSSISS